MPGYSNTDWTGRQLTALTSRPVQPSRQLEAEAWSCWAVEAQCFCEQLCRYHCHKTDIPAGNANESFTTESTGRLDALFLQIVFRWYLSVNHTIGSWPVLPDSMPGNHHRDLTQNPFVIQTYLKPRWRIWNANVLLWTPEYLAYEGKL